MPWPPGPAQRATRVVLAALVAVLLALPSPRAQGVSRQSPGPGAGAAPGSDAPLPDEATFFARARERLASNERLQGQYRYVERGTELNFNVFGKLGSGARQTVEVYPHPVRRMTYRRLIEQDGTPIPPAQIAEQDRAYLQRLDAYRRGLAREGASEREARLEREAERQQRERTQIQESIQLFTFRIEGREWLGGRPAIVVSFSPRPGQRPRSREARVAYAFAGKAWVHEHEYELIRLEATAIDDVSFGWGMIAKLNAGMKILVTRMQLPDGRWVPERSHFVGDGRALMLRKVRIDDLRDYSGYQSYDPDHLMNYLATGERGSGD